MDVPKMDLPAARLTRLFYAETKQKGDILIKNSSGNEVLISPTCGGSFSGEKIRGDIEGIGAGYSLLKAPGRNNVKFKVLMNTDDGEHIVMKFDGILMLDGELEDQLENGQAVSPEDYYYRGTVKFDTGAEKYGWLNDRCCLAVAGIRDWETVCLDVYVLE